MTLPRCEYARSLVLLATLTMIALAHVPLARGQQADVSAPPKEIAAPPTPTAGFRPDGGFVIASPDDRYQLRIGFQGGYRFEPIWRDGEGVDRAAFFVLRPIIAGSLYRPWIRFWTSLELVGNPPFLLDSYVEINPIPEFGIRLGQQWTLFSRHEYYGPQQLLFPDWSVVANYFWSGRDKGATVFGALADGKLDYYVGVYGGSPLRQFITPSGNYVVSARLTWNPLGAAAATEYPYITGGKGPAPFRPSFTINGYYGKTQLVQENFNPTAFRFTPETTGEINRNGAVSADVFLQASRWVVFVEGYWRHTDPDGEDNVYESLGVWGQAGYMLVDQTLDIAVRGNYLDPSRDLDNDTWYSGEAQVGWYIDGPRLVLRARYGIGEQSSPGDAALGPVNLPVGLVGTIQVATLQLMVAF